MPYLSQEEIDKMYQEQEEQESLKKLGKKNYQEYYKRKAEIENRKLGAKIKDTTLKSVRLHKTWFLIFTLASILGIFDISTRGNEIGYPTVLIGQFFDIFLGVTVVGIIMIVIKFIFDFCLLWIILAIVEYKQYKKQRSYLEMKDNR